MINFFYRERDRDRSDSRNYIDGRASKRIRRSRSRDRNYSEMYHDRRSGSEGRKDSARNRDKDRDNSSVKNNCLNFYCMTRLL